MDETEVQVEIVCWAQQHPEAARINWQGANEPWVNFPGKLCTLHIGLGGLIWSIGVPVGYQTELSPMDESRKRCWEPFDFHDSVIVPDRNSPFRVSVLYSKNDDHVLEETRLLVQQPGYDFQEAEENVTNLLKQLQISGDNSHSTSNQEQRLLITNRACFQAMSKAETLSEVLDAIHTLTAFHGWENAALYELQTTGSMDTQSDSSNVELLEDDLFDPEPSYNWSCIRTQVEYAANACRAAKNYAGRGVTDPSSPSAAKVVRMGEEMEGLETTDIITATSESPMLLDSDNELTESVYAYVRVTSSNRSGKNSRNLKGSSSSISRSNSDSDLSVDTDDTWEDVANFSEEVSTDFPSDGEEIAIPDQPPSKNKRMFQQVYAPAEGGGAAALMADIPAASTSTTCDGKAPEEWSRGPEDDVLQYCDISFNSASFSVECTILLEKCMLANPAALTAMGLSSEHPLRVEVVPNKQQVDALAWTGLVEVYVSQQSEWHIHVSEEVCGLLCFVPHVVRQYFEFKVSPSLYQRPAGERKGGLFIGLLETVVKRLVNVSRDVCCVCSGPLDKLSRTLISRIMWPCEENMCQALFASWQAVSSSDADERTRKEQEHLAIVEKDLREDFPYSECILDNLRCALDVYHVNTRGMHYGQLIRALARIELWNRRDFIDQIQ